MALNATAEVAAAGQQGAEALGPALGASVAALLALLCLFRCCLLRCSSRAPVTAVELLRPRRQGAEGPPKRRARIAKGRAELQSAFFKKKM